MSKVVRSRSWGARPPGVVVYNRHGEPIGLDGQMQAPSKPASTIGVGYRPNTALRYYSTFLFSFICKYLKKNEGFFFHV